MAVMKIKTIKSNLQAVINYGKNGDKTDNGILVSSVNCSLNTAYEEMELTKKPNEKYRIEKFSEKFRNLMMILITDWKN